MNGELWGGLINGGYGGGLINGGYGGVSMESIGGS